MKLGKLILKYSFISFFVGAFTYLPAFFIPVSKTFKLIDNYILFFYPVILTTLCIREYKEKRLLKREKLLISLALTIITTLSIMLIGSLNLAGHKLNEAEEAMGGPVGISLHYGFIIFVLTTIAGLVTKNKASQIIQPLNEFETYKILNEK